MLCLEDKSAFSPQATSHKLGFQTERFGGVNGRGGRRTLATDATELHKYM